jgi:hypothetical protein
MRNWNAVALSPRSARRLRACWATQAPSGLAVTPGTCTNRVPTCTAKKTNNRRSVTVSTEKKSRASRMCMNEVAPPIAGSAGCRPQPCRFRMRRIVEPLTRCPSRFRFGRPARCPGQGRIVVYPGHPRPRPRPSATRPRPGGTAPAVGHTALIVALPDTPNAPALPGVRAEVGLLRSPLPDADVLAGPGATRDTVLTALPGHPVAHFACHGSSDWADPDASHLLLHDHDTHPLTISEISRLDLASAGLAYLSACSTTDSVPHLADEAVRITAAFQLAGYQHVIGTLCP